MPEVYEGDRPYIFVCYAHADRDAVLPIIRALVDEGYRVWYDDGIQAATHYPTYIADHVKGCSLFIMFVSHASLDSSWCNNEVDYALDHGKQALPIYLQDVELTSGLEIRIGRVQSLRMCRYDSIGSFYKELFEVRALDGCLTDEGKRQRQTKRFAVQKAKRALDADECSGETLKSVLDELHALSKSLSRKDNDVEQLARELEDRIACEDEKVAREVTKPAGHDSAGIHGSTKSVRTSDNTSSAAPKADVGSEPPKVTPGFQSTHREGVQARQKVDREARRAGDESARDVNTSRKPANVRVAARKDRHPVTPGEPGRPIAVWALVAVVATLMIAAIVFGALNLIGGLGRDAQQEPNDAASVEETGTDANDNDGASRDAFVDGVDSKTSLGDYSWGELKQLSTAIADASDDEWLDIVKAYNLVDTDGKLQGGEKALKLNDGTEASVRILGFRHDELGEGGKAGITFEFADVPVTHQMNANFTNEGGWEQSEMRDWLNSDFLSLLPLDLQSCIETAKKQTNNVGLIDSEDTSVVTTTTNGLWLLSANEVYGGLSGVYGAEGTQYQLYADKSVSTTNYDFCQKRGANVWWWLRSPRAYGSDRFLGVYHDGDWTAYCADADWGVSPGFCF